MRGMYDGEALRRIHHVPPRGDVRRMRAAYGDPTKVTTDIPAHVIHNQFGIECLWYPEDQVVHGRKEGLFFFRESFK